MATPHTPSAKVVGMRDCKSREDIAKERQGESSGPQVCHVVNRPNGTYTQVQNTDSKPAPLLIGWIRQVSNEALMQLMRACSSDNSIKSPENRERRSR